MSAIFRQKLHAFISERFDLKRVMGHVQDSEHSRLLEIVGRPGSGKSHLLLPLLTGLKGTYQKCRIFTPYPLCLNHLPSLVSILTGLSLEDQMKIYEEHYQKFYTGRKYDFFYYITEYFLKHELLKPMALIIDDCDILDKYSRQFLQYIVQYASEAGIQIITFSQKRLFPFSIVETMPQFNAEELQKLLGIVFPDSQLNYISEGEILYNISGGNLLILEKIFDEMSRSKGSKKLDMSPYLERSFDDKQLYFGYLKELDNAKLEFLTAIYIMEGVDPAEVANALGRKSYKQDLDKLINMGLLGEIEDRVVVQKKSLFREWLNEDSSRMGQSLIKKMLNYLKDTKTFRQILLSLYMISASFDEEYFRGMLLYFAYLSDSESSIKLYEYILPRCKSAKNILLCTERIAKHYAHLNQRDKAVDYYRQCLHICTENDLPAEEIVYALSENLFAQNTNNFALEIIKKYSPASIDEYWKAKILLLKSEILTENEDFDEALQCIDAVAAVTRGIKDTTKRYLIHAEAKKIRGNIYYYTNEWDQAEEAFKEAENMYSLAENLQGLAAVNNNIGAIYMFQGDWEKSESYFLKSLAIEKQHYNLNGISVCFNNLGGLMDDKGDVERSLYYLEEALKIQHLLSEPYNITNIYNNIGITLMDNGQYERAEEVLQKSLEAAIEFNFFRNTVASLNNLGALRFKQGDWKGSIEYYEKGIKLSEENGFVEGLLRSFNNLGEVYEKSGELNLAYDLYLKGMELLPEVSDEFIKAELYGNFGSVLTKLHKFKEAYRYLVESLDFFKNLGARDKIFEGCLHQAHYFIMTHNAESADYYVNEALSIAGELQNDFELGRAYYMQGILEKRDPERARKLFKEAVQLFFDTKNQYELSLANYELARTLLELEEWDQALEILKNNKKIIQRYGSVKLLEQHDILMQKISQDYSHQLKELKFEENLLNQFYEITQKLNTISDLDLIIEQSLSSLVDISEADGGIFCLHGSGTASDLWEYRIFKNISPEDKYYESLMKECHAAYKANQLVHHKQPAFAPKFSNILLLPLSIRKNCMGVVLLYSEDGSHYFSERIINLLNSLTNQIIVIIDNIRSANLEKTHASIREQLHEGNLYANIIGKSPEMLKIFEIIEKVKDTPTTVLLEGDSGTGKELIARALHYSSNRANKAFVAQYCGALPESLLESELFGHVKGSFTGAAYDKKGLFEVADGGTFFLDEIADISPSTQAKLLRVLQEGEIKRVGATKTEKVNVRVVCATNIPLLEKVEKGEFRLDLYYRFNVIRIVVPPLKNRPGDVPLLAIHFLDKYNKRIGKNVSGFTAEAMKVLENYDFPGNVRQLENEIERAVTLAEDKTFIRPEDFSEEVYRHTDQSRTIDLLSSKKTLKEAVEELEKQMILSSMEKNDWNQTQSAKELGISRQGLIKKLQRYNMYREEQ